MKICKLLITNAIIISLLLLWSADAKASRFERAGFNFGTSLAINSASDRGNASGDDNASRTGMETTATSVQPYLGFVLGSYFNLGVGLGFQNSTSHDSEQNVTEGYQVERTRESQLRHVSVIFRFLFAEVMYFEAGAGLYDRSINIINENTSGLSSGTFNGRREEYTLRGTGPGYHAGGGFEIPIDRMEGFYFTTSYLVRIFSLRENPSITDLGKTTSRIKQQELSFGIAHYVN